MHGLTQNWGTFHLPLFPPKGSGAKKKTIPKYWKTSTYLVPKKPTRIKNMMDGNGENTTHFSCNA